MFNVVVITVITPKLKNIFLSAKIRVTCQVSVLHFIYSIGNELVHKTDGTGVI